jgi:hypothetical protein
VTTSRVPPAPDPKDADVKPWTPADPDEPAPSRPDPPGRRLAPDVEWDVADLRFRLAVRCTSDGAEGFVGVVLFGGARVFETPVYASCDGAVEAAQNALLPLVRRLTALAAENPSSRSR